MLMDISGHMVLEFDVSSSIELPTTRDGKLSKAPLHCVTCKGNISHFERGEPGEMSNQKQVCSQSFPNHT
jgi:hypothetical protein